MLTHQVPTPTPGSEGEWVAQAAEAFNGEIVFGTRPHGRHRLTGYPHLLRPCSAPAPPLLRPSGERSAECT